MLFILFIVEFGFDFKVEKGDCKNKGGSVEIDVIEEMKKRLCCWNYSYIHTKHLGINLDTHII
jgi:hypothetical protein